MQTPGMTAAEQIGFAVVTALLLGISGFFGVSFFKATLPAINYERETIFSRVLVCAIYAVGCITFLIFACYLIYWTLKVASLPLPPALRTAAVANRRRRNKRKVKG